MSEPSPGIATGHELLIPLEDPLPNELPLLDWFGRSAPLEVEIGSGKGLFLLRESAQRPSVNFLGVEWSRKYARFAADRLSRHGRENVRLLSIDARRLFGRLPAESLEAIHVYFPDPWWKRRHHKRRLVRTDFLEEALRWLRPDGRFHFATDVAAYYDMVIADFAGLSDYVRQPDPRPSAPVDDLDYLTHFERKYRLEGRTIYRALFQKAG